MQFLLLVEEFFQQLTIYEKLEYLYAMCLKYH